MKQFKKILLVITLFVGMITAFAATMPAKKMSAKFKNLKILPKNITEDALNKIMDNFNYSLGVNCNYCHATTGKPDELKFESDAKPEKSIARKMMQMTYDINTKYFNGSKDKLAAQTVNCFTCHRQNAYPIEDTVLLKIK